MAELHLHADLGRHRTVQVGERLWRCELCGGEWSEPEPTHRNGDCLRARLRALEPKPLPVPDPLPARTQAPERVTVWVNEHGIVHGAVAGPAERGDDVDGLHAVEYGRASASPQEGERQGVLANVVKAAREVVAFVSHDGPPFTLDSEDITEAAGEALLSLHDYLNDMDNAGSASAAPDERNGE